MKLFEHTDMRRWRNFLTRLLLVAATVTAIVSTLPRSESKQYHYDVGKPWMYNSFIAKFDFPIYKTDEAIKQQEDSLLAEFQPYYNRDASVEKKQVAKFLKDFAGGIPGLPSSYVRTVADRLHRLYAAGIIDMQDDGTAGRDSTSMIRVVEGKKSQVVQMGCIYTTMSAYEQLFTDPILAAQRPVLQRCNLNNYIEANLTYDRTLSESEKNDLLSSIPPASGMVMSGQKVIDRGDIVDDYTYRVLNSFERESKRRGDQQTELTGTLIGQIILITLFVGLFTTYLWLFRRDYFEKPRSMAMLYVLLAVFPMLVSLVMRHNFLSVYILPFAIAPIFVRVFMDTRTAFIAHVTMVLICTAALRYQYEFIIIQLVAGLLAIYSLRELVNRAQVFKTALIVALGSALVYTALQMVQNNDVQRLDSDMYYHFAVNGVFLLLAYPLMYLIEKTFGFVSAVTLFELSNTNRGLLRDLSEIAPGTFQHSITVGNLAAEIANRVGADSLLVRTGALYHDIGKMVSPAFFTENQAGVNPHDNMTYKESARIVVGHVTEGIKMAERANLPVLIKNFILTHHGTGMAKYFYVKYKNDHPDEDIDTTPFSYPGPNPFTREQAILMMADGVEAASRSLPEYTEQSISALVNRLIDSDVAEGYFRDCPITFRDIAQAKQVLIERLKSIYHTRISYPELKSAQEPTANKEGL